MTARHPRGFGLAVAPIVLATDGVASAQAGSVPATASGQDHRLYVGVKAGLNHEQAEDGLIGSSAGGGGVAGLSFGHSWRGEFEFWIPAFLHDSAGNPKHRDLLFSVSVVRAFDAGRARPYLLAGLSAARTQTYLTTCIADRRLPPPVDTGVPVPAIVDCSEPDVRERHRQRLNGSYRYFLVGAGAEVPLGRRFRLAPELRVDLAATSVIVRPALGFIVTF